MIKIKGLLKTPIYKRLMFFWFYKWINNVNPDKKTFKLFVYLETLIICCTFYVSIPILLMMSIGVYFYRYRIFKRIHARIGFEFQTSYQVKKHKLLGFLMTLGYLILWFIFLSLLFTIVILLFSILGCKYEKKRTLPKKRKKKKQYVFEYIENEKDKTESKSIGYL